MNVLDIIIIVILVVAVYYGSRLGFIQTFFSLLGILIGVVGGILLAPLAMKLVSSPGMRFGIMLAVIVAMSVIFGAIGDSIGYRLNKKLEHPIGVKANQITGGVFGAVTWFIIVWLLAGFASSSPSKLVNNQIQNSLVVRTLNKTLPPTPPIIARLNALVQPLDFPRVFAGAPAKLAEPVAPAGSQTVASAVAAAGHSTVRIESLGCEGELLGSGWIASNRLVMTNAHVVAGSHDTEIVDTEGRHAANVVYFDPDLDVALLRSNNDLAGPVLSIDQHYEDRGVEAVILGFPHGGDFHASGSAIAQRITARGLDIYNNDTINRSVYELQGGEVVPGNSGGPAVRGDGTVIGMVFAAAQGNSGVAYALTSPQLQTLVSNNQYDTQSVSTQQCSK